MDINDNDNVTRSESVTLSVEVDNKQYELVKEHINTIMSQNEQHHLPIMSSGCTLDVNYSFHIDYLGRTAEVFDAYLQIFKHKNITRNVEWKTLNHTESLIKQILDKITEIKKELADE